MSQVRWTEKEKGKGKVQGFRYRGSKILAAALRPVSKPDWLLVFSDSWRTHSEKVIGV